MKYIVIVDGYRVSEQYFDTYKKEGIQCIHVRSKIFDEKGLFPPLDPSHYTEEISYQGNLEDLAIKLQPYMTNENTIIGVMGGIDAGTKLADELSTQLNLPTSNGTKKSAARRDKYEMVEELNKTDPTIKTVTHFKSNDLDAIYNFINALPGHKYPIVLKPVDSAGTDNVAICHTPEDVAKAYESILSSHNVFEKKNAEVLVQTFLKGTEFMVNGVSCNGRYVCTDIWQYCKRINKEGRPLYDYEDALPIEGEIQQKLISYVEKVLQALDIRYGVTHAEIMFTEDGPVLVEIATRVCGCKKIPLYNSVYGINPYDMTVLAYSDEQKFNEVANTRKTDTLLNHARHCDLASLQEGEIQSVPLADFLKTLPCVFSSDIPKPGEKLKKTEDLLTTCGTIILVDKDPKVVKQAYQSIQDFMPRAFVVEPKESVLKKAPSQLSLGGLLAQNWSNDGLTTNPSRSRSSSDPLVLDCSQNESPTVKGLSI